MIIFQNEPIKLLIRLKLFCNFEPNTINNRLMEVYNWQKKEWPHFIYTENAFENELYSFIEKSGMVSGVLKAIPDAIQKETLIEMIVSEAVKTSEIEGEFLSREDVISSVRNNLGLTPELPVKDKRAKGVGALMVTVRNTFSEKISEKMLYDWHTLLMSYRADIESGKWRTGVEPMQVISGRAGKITVHFEAPPATSVPFEMKRFIEWFNETGPGGSNEMKKAPVRAAIAHLYFESIHPFEDGNGRIGRAIAEKALSQGMGRPVLMSLSKTIESNRKTYYAELENAQRYLEITPWIKYFVNMVLSAQTDAENEINFTLKKVKFFDKYKNELNERHQKVISRMLEEGPKGFTGGMNAGKYAGLCKISKATATRDLQYLAEIKAFQVFGGGRSTSYQVNLD
jgi:Fic family protein